MLEHRVGRVEPFDGQRNEGLLGLFPLSDFPLLEPARTPVGAGSQLQPGDFFGEMSVVDGEPRSATIVATTDLRLLIIDPSHFWRLLDEAPDLVR